MVNAVENILFRALLKFRYNFFKKHLRKAASAAFDQIESKFGLKPLF